MTQEEIENVLSEIGEKKLKSILNALKKVKKASMIAKENVKEAEDRMVEELAMSKQYYKKDNKTLDKAKIKRPLLKNAIDIVKKDEANKMQEKADTIEDYVQDIKKEELSAAAIDSFIAKQETLTDTTSEEKEVEKEYMTQFPSDVIKSLSKIAKQLVEEEKIRLKEEKGEKVPQKKDESAFFEIFGAIKRLLSEK